MLNQTLFHANLNRRGEVTRRQLLQLAGGGFASLAGVGLLQSIGWSAEKLKSEGRSCVLVFLNGGASQFETWDPKPGQANGGATKGIKTAIPGVDFAEYWPKMAKQMQDVSVIRSLAGKEAAHERGRYHLRTGRRLLGPTKFPHIGSLVAHKLGDPDSDIPNFVSIGETVSSGFLGVQVAPFVIAKAGDLPENVQSSVSGSRAERRMAMLNLQNESLASVGAAPIAHEQIELYRKAARMMASSRLKAFTLTDESASVKEQYGNNAFGQSCLVARRLVEAGIPFVEVQRGGWDMHSNLWQNIPRTAGEVDQGLSALLTDLKQRGRLDKTVVICLGEFGRTPKINQSAPAPGRDHWARNFTVLIGGGGIKGGVCVGKTNADGTEIVERPVTVDDLFSTICTAMRIDPNEELITPEGRPLRIVDEGLALDELV